MMNIAIIDDDMDFAQVLKQDLIDSFENCNIKIVQELHDFQVNDFNAIFLDIELDDMGKTGFELASEIAYKKIPIIFMTSHREYALDGYAYYPFGFFWKAEMGSRLPLILERLHAFMKKNGLKLGVLDEYNIEVTIALSEIMYIKRDGNYVYIKGKQIYHKRCSITQIETILLDLGANSFLSPTKGFLVNCDNIKEVKRSEYTIYMIDGSAVPLGTKKVHDFLIKKAKIQGTS